MVTKAFISQSIEHQILKYNIYYARGILYLFRLMSSFWCFVFCFIQLDGVKVHTLKNQNWKQSCSLYCVRWWKIWKGEAYYGGCAMFLLFFTVFSTWLSGMYQNFILAPHSSSLIPRTIFRGSVNNGIIASPDTGFTCS